MTQTYEQLHAITYGLRRTGSLTFAGELSLRQALAVCRVQLSDFEDQQHRAVVNAISPEVV